MTDVRSINPGKYNLALADALKKMKEFQKPEWINYVKTSVHKTRPTVEDDFWHQRAASILRQIYIKGIIGVQRLRSRYGGRKDRGSKPPHRFKGGGKIIRKILQQSDTAGLTEKVKGKKSGRQLTKKGKEFLENLAGGSK